MFSYYKLADLKLLIESPRLYLANYFTQLITEIDLKCTEYTLKNGSLIVDEAYESHERMVEGVLKYQSECLENLSLNNTVIRDVLNTIKLVGDNDKMVNDEISRAHIKLFFKGTMIFIGPDWIKDAENCSFGKLFLLEDQFIEPKDIISDMM